MGTSGDADLSGTVDGDGYTYWLNGAGLANPAVKVAPRRF
jgi:hypothetical protein